MTLPQELAPAVIFGIGPLNAFVSNPSSPAQRAMQALVGGGQTQIPGWMNSFSVNLGGFVRPVNGAVRRVEDVFFDPDSTPPQPILSGFARAGSAHPFCEIRFRYKAVFGTDLAAVINGAAISGTFVGAGRTLNGRGRAYCGPRSIVTAVLQALRSGGSLPSAGGVQDDLRRLLELLDDAIKSDFARLMDQLVTLSRSSNDTAIIGVIRY